MAEALSGNREDPEKNKTAQHYTCAICGVELEKDLVLYTRHTEAHIVDEIKKKHPEWIEKDGACAKCLEYYRKAMGQDTHRRENTECSPN